MNPKVPVTIAALLAAMLLLLPACIPGLTQVSPVPTVATRAPASPTLALAGPTSPPASPTAAGSPVTVLASPSAAATASVAASPVASPSAAASPARSPVAAVSPTTPATCVALDAPFQAIQARAQGLKDVFPYAPTVNCPLRPATRVGGALQEFRQPVTGSGQSPKISYMLWREDTKAIYLLVKSDQSTGVSKVYTYQDTWTENEPRVPADCAGMIVPQDVPPATDPSRALQVPVRGFGKVWCKDRWQQAIGYGNGKEVGGTLVIQETTGGLYIAMPPADGRETTSYFLLDTERGGALAP